MPPMNPYSDVYFTKARAALEAVGRNPRVVYQVFQRNHALLCGMEYVVKVLRQELAAIGDIEFAALPDGTEISPGEAVALLTGPAQPLMELETIYLGLLARMTKVATNVRGVVNAANRKPVLFFPARFDVACVQEYDGYAASIGGAVGASTAIQARGAAPVGTMPHALIAAFEGDTVAATLALVRANPHEPVWPLVDFDNDSARTALEVYAALKQRSLERLMAGVRLDTAHDLVDHGIVGVACPPGDPTRNGVNPCLVRHVRSELDRVGATQVQICVSGGFDAAKIRRFEDAAAPVDVYAVGERMLYGYNSFTSDIVGYYRGEAFVPCAKVGRGYKPNPQLRRMI